MRPCLRRSCRPLAPGAAAHERPAASGAGSSPPPLVGEARSRTGEADAARPAGPGAHPDRARRAPFVVLLLVLLASALIGLLLLNTASAQDSFRLHSLQDEDAVLQQQINALTGMADGLDDPATLAKKAAALGLIPGGAPTFLKPGQAIPKGAIRIGNLVYIPGPMSDPRPRGHSGGEGDDRAG